ncbi:endonuclease [Ochrovirga pacifica]|uniref:endonuclease n=1 Tax=Ochrovirga pacifica TaxID=1042376 RepID=UPI0002558B48|nr:endonuclease [Ochrovirga pacifica]
MKKKLYEYFWLVLLLTTTSYAQQSYYSDVDLNKTGLALKEELSSKITSTHTRSLSYSDVWNACKATDQNPDNANEVLLIYGYQDTTTGTYARRRNIHQNGGGSSDWNREHSYPKSVGIPNLGTSGPGADAHHLRASDVKLNNNRGSKKYAAGSGNAGNSNGGWYPGDEWKGDVARMMMYMYLRYGSRCLPSNVGIGSTANTPDNMIDLFLIWNAQDPPSAVEVQRNTYHENTSHSAAQGNRNPFIDNPRLATLIWGGQPAKDTWGIYGGSTPVSDTQAPTAPTNLSIGTITANSIVLNWSAATDNTAVTGYEVYQNSALVQTTTMTQHTAAGLTANTSYSFYVVATDAANNKSNSSAVIQATTSENNGGGSETPTGASCGTENFEETGATSSSYRSIGWTGDNGNQWFAEGARNDGDAEIATNKGLIINSDKEGQVSTTLGHNGIQSFTLTTQRVFSGGSGNLSIKINGNTVGTIPFSDQVQTTTIHDINIEGTVNLVIENKQSSRQRVAIDNLSWTCYQSSLSNNLKRKTPPFIRPNPIDNHQKLQIHNISSVIDSLTIYQTNGQIVFKADAPKNSLDLRFLSSGIYLLQLQVDGQVYYEKLIKK